MSFLIEDRYFSPDHAQSAIARRLYQRVKDLPLVCPHGHVDPRLLAASNYDWGTPVDLLIIPDHYVFRMLYSQGISLEELGIPRKDGGPVEKDHRKIWQIVCDHWYLFRGTPSSLWLRDELRDIFGIDAKINSANAQAIYNAIDEKLHSPEFQPRQLFERFQIEVLATTDAATATLQEHQRIRESGWKGRIVPTFRPDAVVNIAMGGFAENIQLLSQVSGVDVTNYRTYIAALEQRRHFFKEMGATATDHAAVTAYTARLSEREADAIFQRALCGEASAEDAQRFTGHILIEMARMSVEDGLVMQLHVGSSRDHNPVLLERFGRDMGADIPTASEFTHNLKPLLDLYGRERDLTIILFNLDETVYSRELAPLAGHYPALRLGPPWWFFDSWNGIQRYFENVVETAGIYNTAGFNDDTRAYPSIPARHDLWRRASADWLAGLAVRGIVDEDDAAEMVVDMAYRLAKQTYKLEA
ncbi:uronate isomerase [Reticulibacter mediterranei]|uniref:Uronate isomerase n=1 Tax=Reticulibacter mediterranei TaxID=2778369 RepID=A0A8J3IXL4_9CHLR|nr:glucuronate isomerase [Reticulibacter mediterranei]GHO97131.1 uronate isomerase [Reticulibacter mediterranei]